MNANLNRIHTSTTGRAEAVLSDDIKTSNKWEAITWLTNTGSTIEIGGNQIWSYGGRIYYSMGTNHYVLNNGVWCAVSCNVSDKFYGEDVWRVGEVVFCSIRTGGMFSATLKIYRVNADESTITLSEMTQVDCVNQQDYSKRIWNRGSYTYFSYDDYYQKYVQINSTSNPTAVAMTNQTWNLDSSGTAIINGGFIWHDGTDIHMTDGSHNYILGSGNNWITESSNLTGVGYEHYIWTDGVNIYHSNGSKQRKYNKASSTWEEMTWSGLTNFLGCSVWSDGNNIYYGSGSNQYRMMQVRDTKPCYLKNSSGVWEKQNAYIKNDSGIWEQVSYK